MKRDWLWIGACFGLGEVLYYTIRPVVIFWILTIAILIAGICLLRKFINAKADSERDAYAKDVRRAVLICSIAFFIGAARLALAMRPPAMPSEGDILTVEDIQEKNDKLVITAGHALIYLKSGDGYAGDIPLCGTLGSGPDVPNVDNSDIKIGNRIIVTGSFQENSHATNPGQFDFDIYYRAKGIYYTGFADDVTIVSRKVNWPKQLMHDLRNCISAKIKQVYNENDAGFLIAALLGDKSSLDENMNDLYRRNGIAHLLAISGLHIAIIGKGLYDLLRKRFSFRTSGIIAGIWIILYTVFTGASVSTVRACIMLLIAFLAGVKGRKADLLNSAGFAATFVLMMSPYELFNCGMLLSFGSVLGIGVVSRELSKKLVKERADKSNEKNQLNLDSKESKEQGTLIAKNKSADIWRKELTKLEEAFIVSFSVQLFTLPIMSYFFFEISIYGIFLNLIVIPLMTFVVWSGIASVILSFIFMILAKISALSGHYIISLYSWLCSLCDKLPCHTILIGRPKLWQIVIYYFFLLAVLYWRRCHAQILKLLSWMSGRETEST